MQHRVDLAANSSSAVPRRAPILPSSTWVPLDFPPLKHLLLLQKVTFAFSANLEPTAQRALSLSHRRHLGQPASLRRGPPIAHRGPHPLDIPNMSGIYPMRSGNGGGYTSTRSPSRSSENGDRLARKSTVDRDDQEMAYLGKKQQLRRNFGFMSMLGFS